MIEEGGVISWRLVDDGARTNSFSSSESNTGAVTNVEQSSPIPQEVGMSTSGTVTVTIDPPSDENQFYSTADLCKTPFTVSPTEEGMEWNEDCSDMESDSDEEEREEQNKVCLLSRYVPSDGYTASQRRSDTQSIDNQFNHDFS